MAAKFEILVNEGGQFHFNLKAGNGEIILTSQTYTTKASAQDGINSVKVNAADPSRFDRREAASDQPYFVLVAGNAQVIGKSQMYSSASAMEDGIKSVVANAPTAAVVDTTV